MRGESAHLSHLSSVYRQAVFGVGSSWRPVFVHHRLVFQSVETRSVNVRLRLDCKLALSLERRACWCEKRSFAVNFGFIHRALMPLTNRTLDLEATLQWIPWSFLQLHHEGWHLWFTVKCPNNSWIDACKSGCRRLWSLWTFVILWVSIQRVGLFNTLVSEHYSLVKLLVRLFSALFKPPNLYYYSALILIFLCCWYVNFDFCRDWSTTIKW